MSRRRRFRHWWREIYSNSMIRFHAKLRRKLNVKLLGILLGLIFVLGVGVHFLHAYQMKRVARVLLLQADQAEQENDQEKMARYLGRYLSFVPEDTEALVRYGKALLADAKTPRQLDNAYYVLERILRADPTQNDIRRETATLAMKLGSYLAAEAHLKELLKANPDDGELEYLMAVCLERKGSNENALDAYRKAMAHAPQRIEAYLRCAHLQRRLEKQSEAETTLNELIKKNEGNALAWLARAAFRQEYGSLNQPATLEAVATDVAHARKLAPEDADVLLMSAAVSEAKKEVDAARKDLERAIAKHPRDVRTYQALAQVEARAGRRTEAIAALRRGQAAIEKLPPEKQILPLWILADMLIDQGETQEAAAIIARLEKNRLSPALTEYLQARVLISRQEWLAAINKLEALQLRTTPVDLRKQVHYWRGMVYQRLNNPDLQLQAFDQAVGVDPLWLPARQGRAGALLSMGRLEEAIAEFRVLARQSPEAKLLVARLLTQVNLRQTPARRDWNEVQQILDAEEKRQPHAVETALLQAEVHFYQNRPEEARQVLEQCREQNPQKPEPWLALSELARRRGDLAGAQKYLADAQAKLGDSIELRLGQARLTASVPSKPEEKKLVLGQLEKAPASWSENDRTRLEYGLADAYLRCGQLNEATRLWWALAARKPNDLQARLFLFDVMLFRGTAAEQEKLVAELRRVEGEDGPLWRYAQAAVLVHKSRNGNVAGLNQAKLRLLETGNRRPLWSRVPLLEAEIDEIEGNSEQAIAKYQRALELGDRQMQVVRRLVQMLTERGRFNEADQAMRKVQEQAPLFGDLGRLAAEVSLSNQDRDRALELARQSVAADSSKPGDQRWLGQMLMLTGQPQEAEAALRRALQLDETAPENWVALVQFYTRTQQPDKAKKLLDEAAAKVKPEFKALTLAQCHETLNQRDQAESYYDQALTAAPDRIPVLRHAAAFYVRAGKPAKAEPLLRKLLEPGRQAPDAERAWARRNLAVTLATTGDAAKYAQALRLLDENLEKQRTSLEDRRAKALLLAMKIQHHRDAIAMFEDMRRRQPLLPDEQFTLAQLYAAQGDWPKAREQMLGLLQAKADNPQYLAFYLEGLMRRSRFDEAQIWQEKLEKLEPDSWRTHAYKAKLLHGKKQSTEAAALIKRFVERKDANVLAAAALLEEIEQYPAAEELYLLHVTRDDKPERVLPIAEYYGRRGRTREALDICDNAWKSCPPRAVAATSVSILRKAVSERESHQARVKQALQRALAGNPSNFALLQCWADFNEQTGNYPEAIAVYRQVLQQNPNHVVMHNNLAWLLAWQTGGVEEALRHIERAIAIAGPIPELLDTRAMTLLARGRPEAALKDLEEIVRLQPTAYRHYHLALARRAAKMYTRAQESYQQAKSLGLLPDQLHPLERPLYRQAVAEWESR